HELVRRLITRMIEDVLLSSRERLAALAPASPEAVRHAGEPVVAFSAAMTAADRAIKDFLFARMYRHPRIRAIMQAARGVVADLYRLYACEPHRLPADWLEQGAGSPGRRAGDFIAGMTDNFALAEHA